MAADSTMTHTSGISCLLLVETDMELRKIFATINPIICVSVIIKIIAEHVDEPVQRMFVVACKQNEIVIEILSWDVMIPTGVVAANTTIMMLGTRPTVVLMTGTTMTAHDRPQTTQSR
jgi:hypothetical protein